MKRYTKTPIKPRSGNKLRKMLSAPLIASYDISMFFRVPKEPGTFPKIGFILNISHAPPYFYFLKAIELPFPCSASSSSKRENKLLNTVGYCHQINPTNATIKKNL